MNPAAVLMMAYRHQDYSIAIRINILAAAYGSCVSAASCPMMRMVAVQCCIHVNMQGFILAQIVQDNQIQK